MFSVITEKESYELKQTASRYFNMLRNYQDFLDNDSDDKPPHPIYIRRKFHMNHAEFYKIRRQYTGMNEGQIAELLELHASLEKLKKRESEIRAFKAIQFAYFEACKSDKKRRYDADKIGTAHKLTREEKLEFFNVKSVKKGDLKANDHKNILIEESLSLLLKAQPDINIEQAFELSCQIMNQKLPKERVNSTYKKLKSQLRSE